MSDFITEYDRIFSRAIEMLKAQGLDALNTYVSSIQDTDYRDTTLSRLGKVLAGQGRSDVALELASEISQPMERADCLLEIAREQIERGEKALAHAALSQAVSAAEQIVRSTWEIPSILLEVSVETYGLGFETQGLTLLNRATDLAQLGGDFESAKVLSGSAVVLAKWGHVERAKELAASLKEPAIQALTFQRIEAATLGS